MKSIVRQLVTAQGKINRLYDKMKSLETKLAQSRAMPGGIYRSPKDPETNRHFYVRLGDTSVRFWLGRDGPNVRFSHNLRRCTRDGLPRGRWYTIPADKFSEFTRVQSKDDDGKS